MDMSNVRRGAVVTIFMVGAAVFGAMSLNWLGAIPKARRRDPEEPFVLACEAQGK